MSDIKHLGGRALRIAVGIMMMGLLLAGWAGASSLNNEQSDLFYLKNGYAIRIIAIDQEIFPPRLWLALEKEEIKIDDVILNSGEEYSFKKDLDEIKVKIEGFEDKENNIVFLKNIYQSSNGETLLNYENSTLYPSNSMSSFQGTIDRVNLYLPVSGENGVKQAAPNGSYAFRQITVDDDGPADYSTIQQAIDAASSGDTILVKNGKYYENLIIEKNNLTIIGEDKETTIIEGEGEGGIIYLNGVNNNTLKNITIQKGFIKRISFPEVFGNTRVVLKENYNLILNALDARTNPRQAWITLYKNNSIFDEIILQEGTTFNEERSGKLIFSLRTEKFFAGTSSDYILLSNITQYSGIDNSVIVRNETALLKIGVMDAFIPANGGIERELHENYSLSVLDADVTAFQHRQSMLLLSKNGSPVDFKILNDSEKYSYFKDGKLILKADMEAVFGSPSAYMVKLSQIYQYSELNPDILLNNTLQLYVVGSPRTAQWQLFQNYSLIANDIDSNAFPRQVWLRFSKDNVTIEDKITQKGSNYTFYKNETKILNLSVPEIYDGRNTDFALVSNVDQYSEIDPDTLLIENGSNNFVFGSFDGIEWQLYEDYALEFMGSDIKNNPGQAWFRMKKNGSIVNDITLFENQVYSYSTPSGRLILIGNITKIFSGNTDFLNMTKLYQYSESDSTPLIVNITHNFYPRNLGIFEKSSERLVMYENYTIVPIDVTIKTSPRKLWMRLYKNDLMVDEIILEARTNYSYYAGKSKIISTKLDTIFSGATTDMLEFREIYQYSEVNGTLLMYIPRKILALGIHYNAGVFLDGSNENVLQDLRISNNYYGIYLKNSSFNTINSNNIKNNMDIRLDAGGILLSSSSTNNTIHTNNITNNSNGVYIKYTYFYINGSYFMTPSIDNYIYHNSFLNNNRNGYDDYSANRWDSGYPSGGNYWSDYIGSDLKSGPGQNITGSDGIGDALYYISGSGGAQDRYPFMNESGWNEQMDLPPVAECGADKLRCENVGSPVQFNGSASYDPDGTIVSYIWEFGDGTTGTGAEPVHKYNTSRWNGTAYQPFIANLTVIDNSDMSNTNSQKVVIWIAGDANGDGKVNILDASVVGLKWNSNPADPCADLNNDGKVNILDASIIGLNWGKIPIIQ